MPLRQQNEISEVFDKLHHVNGSDSAIEVTDSVDSIGNSPKPLIKEKPILRKLNDGVKSGNIEEWNSMAQFEKLIKLEMENLAAAEKSNSATPLLSTTKTTSNNNTNILKPEKHVRVSL